MVSTCASWIARWAAQDPGIDPGGRLELSPLTPQFKADQHQFYLSHLDAALNHGGIRNIALTGRYGAGKSSVLMEFARQNEQRVLFLSLSTLGPEDPNETKTNQIEKELVKQLLHREKPARLPQSRYQRIERLSTWRAIVESAAFLSMIALGLWLFDVVPNIPGLHGEAPVWVRFGAGALAVGFSVLLLAAVRIAVHNRFTVAGVSAAGTTITLTSKSETYFDKYLDEIVYFFESRRQVDVVVFEDLDRFNHAGIFEALRELNTILNNSKQVTRSEFRRSRQRSIRFVYALRDSIFEQLGQDTKELKDDAAQAEAVRANRTKFFDLVIPLVPFITHRTARDLLGKVLADRRYASVPTVGDELVDLVALHIPDMRLLTNICNEYSIFAGRLITDHRGMDTLTANRLFALVVYKNLHLQDFEFMLLGRSNLDAVYQFSRDLINHRISMRSARLREISDGLALQDLLREQASNWGASLKWFFDKMAQAPAVNMSVVGYVVNNVDYDVSAITTSEFWQAVLGEGSGLTAKVRNANYGNITSMSLAADEVRRLLGNGFAASAWSDAMHDDLLREQNTIKAELNALRIAGFVDLAKHSDFTLNRDNVEIDFRQFVVGTISSKLGQAFILDGYIDRYYNIYAAQYYGGRVPTNAMSYIVQNIDANKADIRYPFSGRDEIVALLNETKRSFLSDLSAYNIGILDYLLATNDDGAHVVLGNLVRHVGEKEREFLDAYLNEGAQAADAVAYFATQWSETFVELVERAALARTKRIQLVDIALRNSNRQIDYQFDEIVSRFFHGNYKEFQAIALPADADKSTDEVPVRNDDPTEQEIVNAISTLGLAHFECDDLAAVRSAAVRHIVAADCYSLSARNLHAALSVPGSLSLDRIRNLDVEIYQDALARPDEYLKAIESERQGAGTSILTESPPTWWTIEDPAAFTSIVSELGELRNQDIVNILRVANPDGIVEDLATVAGTTWEALAECRRFPPTLGNVDAYIQHLGEIDASLAAILTYVESVVLPDSEVGSEEGIGAPEAAGESAPDADEVAAAKARVAEAVLNASVTMPDSRMRAKIVGSLDLDSWFPVAKVPVEDGQLLGKLIEERICKDEADTFVHFNINNWATLSYGIKQSANFADFVTPDLLDPSAARQVFDDSEVKDTLKRAILSRFDEFVPSDNRAALAAAGRAALATDFNPGASKIATIARGTEDGDLVVRLLNCFSADLRTEEVLDALLGAGEPYSRLATTGEKLTFPRNDHHEAVLQRLRASELIKSRAHAKSLVREARIEVEVL